MTILGNIGVLLGYESLLLVPLLLLVYFVLLLPANVSPFGKRVAASVLIQIREAIAKRLKRFGTKGQKSSAADVLPLRKESNI